jgi:hypothetical protein
MPLREGAKRAGGCDALLPMLLNGAIKTRTAVIYRSDGKSTEPFNRNYWLNPAWWRNLKDLDVETGSARLTGFGDPARPYDMTSTSSASSSMRPLSKHCGLPRRSHRRVIRRPLGRQVLVKVVAPWRRRRPSPSFLERIGIPTTTSRARNRSRRHRLHRGRPDSSPAGKL